MEGNIDDGYDVDCTVEFTEFIFPICIFNIKILSWVAPNVRSDKSIINIEHIYCLASRVYRHHLLRVKT